MGWLAKILRLNPPRGCRLDNGRCGATGIMGNQTEYLFWPQALQGLAKVSLQ